MQSLLNIFFVSKIVRLLLKENVQPIFFMLKQMCGSSGNISMFFNKRATASGRVLEKMPPGKMPPEISPPGKLPPGKLSPRKIALPPSLSPKKSIL